MAKYSKTFKIFIGVIIAILLILSTYILVSLTQPQSGVSGIGLIIMIFALAALAPVIAIFFSIVAIVIYLILKFRKKSSGKI